MNDIYRLFESINEPFASGFYEKPDKSRFYKYANAYKSFWSNMTMPLYRGGKLYPCGVKYRDNFALVPDYSYTVGLNHEIMKEKSERGYEIIVDELGLYNPSLYPHDVGGLMYTHSLPNYGLIIAEGLNSYKKRVERIEEHEIREGLLVILEGIEIYWKRSIKLLEESSADSDLISALKKVPFEKADTLYEAMVCWNFIYYIDGCDNPGRLDADLYSYYKGEDITEIIAEFYDNVNDNSGWSSSLGPKYNELTLQCLKAVVGKRRPSLELRVLENMPESVWKAATEAIMSGCGQPAFYNEKLYQDMLQKTFPHIPKEDLLRFNGGGCTETMLAGISNVGSLDAGINIALIFSDFFRGNLEKLDTFNDFYSGLLLAVKETVLNIMESINKYQKLREEYRPQPVRTLLIDDCIDKQKEYNAGGARYYWSIINLAGLINVIDSLLVIKHYVYDEKTIDRADFISKLDAGEISTKNIPCYGTDNETADSLASQFLNDVFGFFDLATPYLGGKFLPSSIQFATYEWAGKNIPATPDGRASCSPLCDSVGAIHAKDTKGITSLLNSVSKQPFNKALGTPVLNINMQKTHVEQYLPPVIKSFFANGGMHMQVSCTSRKDMEKAIETPENYKNLIVRIGGYAEYFNVLSDELKRTVIERTVH